MGKGLHKARLLGRLQLVSPLETPCGKARLHACMGSGPDAAGPVYQLHPSFASQPAASRWPLTARSCEDSWVGTCMDWLCEQPSTSLPLICDGALHAESDDSVLMELELPFWTETDDVITDIQPLSIDVRVRGGPCLHRTCWKSRWAGLFALVSDVAPAVQLHTSRQL